MSQLFRRCHRARPSGGVGSTLHDQTARRIGQDETRKTVENYLEHTTHMDIEIVNLATAGNIVLTERVDHFVFGGPESQVRDGEEWVDLEPADPT